MSLPGYPKYKDAGVEWLGQVPEHWCVNRLKWNLLLQTEKTDRRQNPVALENIESWTGRFIPTDTEFLGEGVAFDIGHILFGKLRPYLAKAYLAERPGEAVGDFHVLRPSADTDSRFAQYQILNREFIDIVDGSTFGSKMPRASWEFVGGMMVTTPPIPEQTQIAAFLDRETAKIDAMVADQRRLMELLKEKRQAILSHAVTKGLNPDAPMKPSGIEWLGDVPEHWDVIKMKWIARMESGHTPDKKIPGYWDKGDIPWVSLNDTGYLKDHDYISETAYNISELGMANSSARLLPARVVVFSRDATIGRCAITTRPMAVSQHFIAWVCGESMVPEFLLLRLRSMVGELDRLTTGATLKTIGMPDVRTLVTPVPSVGEQREIINHVAFEVGKVDNLLAEIQRAIDLLQERRTALISAAVTGQIDVRDLSPSEAT